MYCTGSVDTWLASFLVEYSAHDQGRGPGLIPVWGNMCVLG